VTAASFVGDGSGLTNVTASTASDLNCAGCVAESELAFDVATQSELDAEATTRAAADATLQAGIDARVHKAGDTMSGTLNLPTNGLVAGTTQLVLSSGNVGIGTSGPGQKLEVNGGVRLNTATLQPTCDATARGTFWVTQGGPGTKDSVEVCAKDASDTYAWRTLY
jgi:hypothetical protein